VPTRESGDAFSASIGVIRATGPSGGDADDRDVPALPLHARRVGRLALVLGKLIRTIFSSWSWRSAKATTSAPPEAVRLQRREEVRARRNAVVRDVARGAEQAREVVHGEVTRVELVLVERERREPRLPTCASSHHTIASVERVVHTC
jgi:hypothetical protein